MQKTNITDPSSAAQSIVDKTKVAKALNSNAYAYDFSQYQTHRHNFVPGTPSALAEAVSIPVTLKEEQYPIAEGLDQLFPTLLSKGMKYFELGADPTNGRLLKSDKPLNLGCVLSGGQAAGGHNVIMGLFDMAKKLHPDSKLFGFLAGPHGVFTGNYMEITPEYMNLYRNMGGFDMIRAGRHKIETPEQFASSLEHATKMDLDGLAVIGGDDSNTNACLLAEYFAANNSKCTVIGCPKTIDGDLRNEHIQVSFGFDTATKVYSEAIGNLCTDAVSSRNKYHFVRLMGRSASHIVLECALQTRVNCALIGEEVQAKHASLEDITMQVADVVCRRSERGKDYGVVLVPEGLIEFIPEVSILIAEINEILAKDFTGEIEAHVIPSLTESSRALFTRLPRSVSSQLLLDRDPHGNVQVSKIDTERLLILMVKKELENRRKVGVYKGTFKPQSHFFGYEGRCALPSNFDSSYCYAIGMNAANLMLQQRSGYMSCVKNLGEPDPSKWVAAGCPLPAMMGIERRHGKDKPVITKALVKLEDPMFKCFETVRAKWAYLDCYQSVGPIQFKGASSNALNFMVSPPDVDSFVYATEVQEKYENRHQDDDIIQRQESALSVLSRSRIRAEITIPDTLKNAHFRMTAIKKYQPYSQLVQSKIIEQFPHVAEEPQSTYFVEIQDRLLADPGTYKFQDPTLEKMNAVFTEVIPKTQSGKFALLNLGNCAPGQNNIVDGLLKFQLKRKSVQLVGYLNGLDGVLNDRIQTITEESFAPYRNLGGCDYLGRSGNIPKEFFPQVAESVTKHGITGLVMAGATHTMTDAASLTEYFMQNGVDTRVIVVPVTLDGNIRHNFLQMSLGFDTASKVYSQLIGNMLTDSASAIKYWYFIRLMGREPSHLALECALKTHPNMVIISEECAFRNETLPDVVNRIADVVTERAAKGKNFGTVLIPEGLMAHISAYKQLIVELNDLFKECQTSQELLELQEKLTGDDAFIKEKLSPWSFSLFVTLPDFMKQQLVNGHELSGEVNLASFETEKLLAYFVAEEMAKRKAAGVFKGSFAPVTHYFGYQGRSAHPSNFDCNLGSTLGYAAAALLDSGLTGQAVSVKELTNPASQWRIGGVPLLALLRSQPKSGYKRHELVVSSQEIQLSDLPYQILKANERDWRFVDHYCNPGPIQFQDKGSNDTTDTLEECYKTETDIADQIKGLCNSINNQTMFCEHQHLLLAALASLKSAKGVLNAMSDDQTLGSMRVMAEKKEY